MLLERLSNFLFTSEQNPVSCCCTPVHLTCFKPFWHFICCICCSLCLTSHRTRQRSVRFRGSAGTWCGGTIIAISGSGSRGGGYTTPLQATTTNIEWKFRNIYLQWSGLYISILKIFFPIMKAKSTFSMHKGHIFPSALQWHYVGHQCWYMVF